MSNPNNSKEKQNAMDSMGGERQAHTGGSSPPNNVWLANNLVPASLPPQPYRHGRRQSTMPVESLLPVAAGHTSPPAFGSGPFDQQVWTQQSFGVRLAEQQAQQHVNELVRQQQEQESQMPIQQQHLHPLYPSTGQLPEPYPLGRTPHHFSARSHPSSQFTSYTPPGAGAESMFQQPLPLARGCAILVENLPTTWTPHMIMQQFTLPGSEQTLHKLVCVRQPTEMNKPTGQAIMYYTTRKAATQALAAYGQPMPGDQPLHVSIIPDHRLSDLLSYGVQGSLNLQILSATLRVSGIPFLKGYTTIKNRFEPRNEPRTSARMDLTTSSISNSRKIIRASSLSTRW